MTIEENDLQQTGQSSFDRRVIQIKPLRINIEKREVTYVVLVLFELGGAHQTENL